MERHGQDGNGTDQMDGEQRLKRDQTSKRRHYVNILEWIKLGVNTLKVSMNGNEGHVRTSDVTIRHSERWTIFYIIN